MAEKVNKDTMSEPSKKESPPQAPQPVKKEPEVIKKAPEPDKKEPVKKTASDLTAAVVCRQYLPVVGSFSVLAFSANVMNQKLFRSWFSPYDLILANSLWFNAHLGTGIYIYTRRHVAHAGTYQCVMFSVAGSVLFNFGTVLFWATTKTLLPQNDALRTIFGIASGILFLAVGREYLKFVDEHSK